MDIKPYKISVPDKDIEELRKRLALAKFPSQLEGPEPWDFGAPKPDVERLIHYWRDKFDWREAEAKLNELPQFITKIDADGFGELDIHFVHQRGPSNGAIPLLFSHGWPGSFLEVKKLLPLLTTAEQDGGPLFHVVAPSLPNYGFSSGVSAKGFGLLQYAEVFHKLMLKLGYDEYVTQGGDWGFRVTRAMGYRYPAHCKASHLNLIIAGPPSLSAHPLLYLKNLLTPYNSREQGAQSRRDWFLNVGYGYNIEQSTKPQTISFALADSPTGLLAWIYEKLHDWTDDYPWTDDEILTWISIYWFSTAGPGASVRIYYEAQHPDNTEVSLKLRQYVPDVKLGLAHFPKEIYVVPKTWGETLGPVVLQSEHEHGGHFAAWEHPEAIASDLQKMFGKGGKCYGIIQGRSGGYTN